MEENYQQRYSKTPMGKYIRQRSNAYARHIPWEFTFEEWWELWQKSGKWDERGHKPGQYYMCRKGDVGSYSPQNVTIKTISENAKEARMVRKERLKPENKDWWTPYPRKSAWDYPHSNLDAWLVQHGRADLVAAADEL